MFHSRTAGLPKYHAVESDDAVMTSDEIKDNAVINDDADVVAAIFRADTRVLSHRVTGVK